MPTLLLHDPVLFLVHLLTLFLLFLELNLQILIVLLMIFDFLILFGQELFSLIGLFFDLFHLFLDFLLADFFAFHQGVNVVNLFLILLQKCLIFFIDLVIFFQLQSEFSVFISDFFHFQNPIVFIRLQVRSLFFLGL